MTRINLEDYIQKQQDKLSDLEFKKAAEIKEVEDKYSLAEENIKGKIEAANELLEEFDGNHLDKGEGGQLE